MLPLIKMIPGLANTSQTRDYDTKMAGDFSLPPETSNAPMTAHSPITRHGQQDHEAHQQRVDKHKPLSVQAGTRQTLGKDFVKSEAPTDAARLSDGTWRLSLEHGVEYSPWTVGWKRSFKINPGMG
jgi:hypothetical protein